MSRALAFDPKAPHFTQGDRVAIVVKTAIGSWKFIIVQSVLTILWIFLNLQWAIPTLHYDPFPFILLNLTYSFQAGFTGPILLIASNVGDKVLMSIVARDDEELGALYSLQKEQMVHHIYQTEVARALVRYLSSPFSLDAQEPLRELANRIIEVPDVVS